MKKFLYITLAFILCFTAVMPVSYADTVYPSLDTIPGYSESEASFLLREISTDTYYLYFFDDYNDLISSAGADFNFYVTSSNKFGFNFTYPGSSDQFFKYSCYQFLASYSPDWLLSGKDINTSNVVTNSSVSDYEIIFSTHDFVNTDGTTFFPLPPTELHQVIQGVTNQEMTTFPTTVGGTMRILVLCGVGCLALLMVFPLFGKVLKRYLPR